MGFAVTMRRPLKKMTTMNPCSFSSLAIQCRLLSSSSSSSKSQNPNPNPFSSSSSSAIGGGIPNPTSRAPPSSSLFNRAPNFRRGVEAPAAAAYCGFRRSHTSSSSSSSPSSGSPPVIVTVGERRYISVEDLRSTVMEMKSELEALQKEILEIKEENGRTAATLDERDRELQRMQRMVEGASGGGSSSYQVSGWLLAAAFVLGWQARGMGLS